MAGSDLDPRKGCDVASSSALEPVGPVPLRELLAGYDRQVDDLLRDALDAETGTARVQAMFLLRRAVAVHDSVLDSALCPILDDLPGGAPIAESLRDGCRQRAALLARFQKLTQGVAAHNVYVSAPNEVEEVLAGLTTSFHEHEAAEAADVTDVLERSAGLVDPEVVSARMALEVDRAPTRAHAPSMRRLRALTRSVDTFRDWSDGRHRWPSPTTRPTEWPAASSSVGSIRTLLASYDTTVEGVVDDVHRASSPEERLMAGHRLVAAVTVHDAVLAGSLCALLESVDDGRALAERLREGCQTRAELLERWTRLVRGLGPEDLARLHAEEAEAIITRLVESFAGHAAAETAEVSVFVDSLRERAWPTRGSAAGGMIARGPNPEPGVLAAAMALSAAKAPTHAHPLLTRHPTNRLVKVAYRQIDRVRDMRDSSLGWSAASPRRPETARRDSPATPSADGDKNR